MKDNKKYLYFGVILLTMIIGVSLAYFGITIIGNDTAKKNKIVTGNLELTFTDNDEITLNNAFPGDSFTKTISVKNTGTKEVSYNLVWTELTNEITNNELVMEATCKRLNNSGTEEGRCNSILEKVVSATSNITSNIAIEADVTHEYTVKVTFIDTGKPQNYNKNKSFSGKLGITESSAKTVYCTYDGELTDGVSYINQQYTYRYLQSDGGWSVYLTDKTSTDPVVSDICTYVNNIPITSMSNLFGNSQATSIDISHVNTSKVTNMSGMFTDSKVTSVDLSSFDTSNVTLMDFMFMNSQIISIDLSNFNTSKVTQMNRMFALSQVNVLDLSSFDVRKVTDMTGMFNNSQLITIDVSSFDTNNIMPSKMGYLFANATNLKTIYASDKFSINMVGTMSKMFIGSTNLVGEAGTVYDSEHVDEDYAHIDGGTSNPGYFTDVKYKPSSFADDSWETIAASVKAGNIRGYKVGETKTIDMGSYGTHTLRIANISTPSECSTTGFSQTACGFVLEFADIVTDYAMNDTNTNVGGWSATKMRTFLNKLLITALPVELQNVIIDTKVVSGHGSTSDESNFVSTDKLYLLSAGELWGDSTSSSTTVNQNVSNLNSKTFESNNNIVKLSASSCLPKNCDTAISFTRQLDYYKLKNITINNYSENIKLNSTDAYSWWLRTPYVFSDIYFYQSKTDGSAAGTRGAYESGVSPAFRIG